MNDHPNQEADAFAKLNTLIGRWQDEDESENVLVEYRLNANGSVLVESWNWPDRSIEALTLYHMDIDRLMATHYCPIGNQPRLYLNLAVETPGFTFEIESVTNLTKPTMGHNIAFTIEILSDRSFMRSETYLSDEVTDTQQSIYHRR